MAVPDDFSAQLALLRSHYIGQLDGVLSAMENQVAESGTEIATGTLAALGAQLHKLAGSGGTFGFPLLSQAARKLEIVTDDWLAHPEHIDVSAWLAWKADLLGLRQTLRPPVEEKAAPSARRLSPPASRSHHAPIRLVLIEDDIELGEQLSRGLGQFGYEVSHYPGFAPAQNELLSNPPDMLLVDIVLSGQIPAAGNEGAAQLFTQLGYRLPTLFMSALTDFSAQMAAAQAGGGAFLQKPVDVPSLAEKIERLLQNPEEIPYRVLIVDDDEVLAEHYRLALAAAGMIAAKVCNPAQVLAAMDHLNPDLVLLDLYMPGYSGAELARAIRYGEKWQGLPIVFLSAEDDLDRQTTALTSGADDFLTKPISDVRLVAAVRVRAARARTIDELMSRDSLTGLLKHASIKDRMAQEADRARRQGKPLSVVMVDIDHFKRVNDTWGHPMGDQVIKTLAHLLRQRLRRQDSIGRYGGEEFVAVLPECSSENAKRLLDDIRRRFAEIRFMHGDRSFNVALSAGIATTADYPAPSDLLAAADAALYVAKQNGRNQVRLAPQP